MNTIEIVGKTKKSTLLFGEKLDNVLAYTGGHSVFIITDTQVAKLYGNQFPAGDCFRIGIGESVKTADTVMAIYDSLLRMGYDRSTFVLGIGGGLVCDIAGFVASTYMRGNRFGFVPTTLLAQVDAAIGGKNGFNFGGYKNIIGTFNQPDFILSDFSLLNSLSTDELKNGIAESIKHALIGDSYLFDLLMDKNKEIMACDMETLSELIERSAKVKIEVVNRDETETNLRKILNFGHTLGHAVEICESQAHGKAVSVGMAFAAAISNRYGMITEGVYESILALLDLYGLPNKTTRAPAELLEKMVKDKKKRGEIVDFILLKGIGEPVIKGIQLDELEVLVNDLC